MYSDILSRIRTKEEALRLDQEVDMLLEKIYETKEGAFEEALTCKVRTWVSEEIRTSLAKGAVDKLHYLRELKEAISRLKTLKLTLAFEPVEDTLNKIHSWVRREVGEGIILDITFNRNILAGAIIIFGGEYRNCSFRKKFEEDLKNNKEEIMKILGEEARGINGITTGSEGK